MTSFNVATKNKTKQNKNKNKKTTKEIYHSDLRPLHSCRVWHYIVLATYSTSYHPVLVCLLSGVQYSTSWYQLLSLGPASPAQVTTAVRTLIQKQGNIDPHQYLPCCSVRYCYIWVCALCTASKYDILFYLIQTS